jgi:hypothetical protein
MFRVPANVGEDASKTNVDNNILTSLAENLRVISETLVKTQSEAAEVRAESEKAQRIAAEAQANNQALQAQIDCQNEKRAGGYKFRHLGNEIIYFAHIDSMSKISRGLSAMKLGQINSAEALFTDSYDSLMQSNKYVKIADNSPAGWNLVQEILGTEMASTQEEERKFKKAEQACDAKYKRKLEADQRARGPAKKAPESAVSVVSTPRISSAANGTQYVQFPLQALTSGAQPSMDRACKHCHLTIHRRALQQQMHQVLRQITDTSGMK